MRDHVGFAEVMLARQSLNVHGRLIVIVRIRPDTALPNRIDAARFFRRAKIDYATGGWPESHGNRQRGNRVGKVIGRFMAAGRRERTGVEDPVERLDLPQRMTVSQRVSSAPSLLGAVVAKVQPQMFERLIPRHQQGIGTALFGRRGPVVPPW